MAVTPRRAGSAHRRALAWVVILNLGYGLIEAAGGILAESQALKADALDFLGDGLITLLGLAALGWSPPRRARVALVQGVFLGVLGLGVLAETGWRMVAPPEPVAEAMGVLAALALVVNLAAAAILLPHRGGDASMRAVWLFSRNDAIGNLLVVGAAGLVFTTGSAWPDLAVGGLMAALFLQSAASIMRRARQEMRPAPADASPLPGD